MCSALPHASPSFLPPFFQPAVNVRISRNSKFYMQGPFECSP